MHLALDGGAPTRASSWQPIGRPSSTSALRSPIGRVGLMLDNVDMETPLFQHCLGGTLEAIQFSPSSSRRVLHVISRTNCALECMLALAKDLRLCTFGPTSAVGAGTSLAVEDSTISPLPSPPRSVASGPLRTKGASRAPSTRLSLARTRTSERAAWRSGPAHGTGPAFNDVPSPGEFALDYVTIRTPDQEPVLERAWDEGFGTRPKDSFCRQAGQEDFCSMHDRDFVQPQNIERPTTSEILELSRPRTHYLGLASLIDGKRVRCQWSRCAWRGTSLIPQGTEPVFLQGEDFTTKQQLAGIRDKP